MIRVLHSVSNMDRAGIETMLMNYYRHLDHTMIQFDFLCNKLKPGAYDAEIEELGGRIYHTPGLNPIKYPKYLAYMKQLLKEHSEYRIVEAHNGALGVYALYAARKNNVPVRIFHAHGASITRDLKMPLKLFCKSQLPKNMNRHFTCGIAAAEYYFGKDIVQKGEYRFVPNAIEIERFLFHADVRDRLRKEYNLQDKHVIGHVGRFMTQKNHTFLLDVFAELAKIDKDAYLVLLGDGELMDAMKQKVSLLGLEEQVRFVGNVGNANEWYQAFDVFVLPSIWEGLPVVGVEAQAADLPCVFSDAITKEIGFSDKAQFVALDSPVREWASVIKKKLEDTSRGDCYNLITDKGYNIKIEAIKLQEIYLQMCEEK